MVIPALGIAAGSALLGAGASLFGGSSYDPMGALQDFRNNRPKLNSPLYPGVTTSTPGGGYMGYNPVTTVDMTSQGKRLNNALQGKGKNKNLAQNNPGLFNYLKNGGDITKIPKELFGSTNQGLLGLGKQTKGADFQAQPEAAALQGFNALQQAEIQRLQQAQMMNQYSNAMLMPQMMNTFGGVFNNAGQILRNGLTSQSPGLMDAANQVSNAQASKTLRDYNQQYTDQMSGMFQNLGDSGNIFSSDGINSFNRASGDYGKGLADILNNRDINAYNYLHQSVGENQNALNTLYGAGSFNNILGGMNQNNNTPYNINPAALSPTGLFTPEFLANQMQFGAGYAQNKDQMIQNGYNNDVQAAMGSAAAQAGMPTPGQGIASIFGGLAGTAGGLGIAKYLFPQGFGGSSANYQNAAQYY